MLCVKGDLFIKLTPSSYKSSLNQYFNKQNACRKHVIFVPIGMESYLTCVFNLSVKRLSNEWGTYNEMHEHDVKTYLHTTVSKANFE